MLLQDDLKDLLEKDLGTGLLLASWLGKYSALRKLLDTDANIITARDNCGRFNIRT